MDYRLLLFPLLFLLFAPGAHAQTQPLDTVVVQTLTYDSLGRAGVFHFPDTGTYERVLLDYSMRCHHALVSNGTQTEQGCGQWDYNCETYLWDSTRTDSLKNATASAVISNYPSAVNFPCTTTPTFSVIRRDEKIVRYPARTTFLVDSSTTKTGPGLSLMPDYQRMYFVVSASDPLWKHVNKASSIAGIILGVAFGADTLRDLRVRVHAVKPGSYPIMHSVFTAMRVSMRSIMRLPFFRTLPIRCCFIPPSHGTILRTSFLKLLIPPGT